MREANFHQLAVHVLDAVHQSEIDREEDAQGNERNLGGFVDPQPKQEQGCPGQGWQAAQGLERRVQQPAGQRPVAGESAKKRCHRPAE